jgi:hypothetical protein
MTTRKATETPTDAQTDTRTDLERIKQLEAQKRQLDAELKTAKASMNPLDRVIADQVGRNANPLLKGKVTGRIKAGQNRDEAIEAVIAAARERLQAEFSEE